MPLYLNRRTAAESIRHSMLPAAWLEQVTDLDVAVLLGIATSLLASLEVGPAGDSTSPSRGNRTGASLLDRAQKRMVTSLRQAFRRADVNGDGILDRDEVENLLRHHLEGHQVDPAQREAEVVQFIS